jgi:tetratricopeptide (TPR) repeat protein
MTVGIRHTGRCFIVSAAFLLISITAVSNACAEGLSEADINRHLEEGGAAFRRAVELDRSDPQAARDYYRKAILHFELIEGEGGVRNGKLYYNIGNAYFRLDNLGWAILNYKRASLYMPNNENLEQNLEQARNRRLDKIEKKQAEKVFKTLFFLHYDIPSHIRLTLFTAFFAAAWLLAALRLFSRSGGLRVGFVISVIASAVLLTSLVAEGMSASRRPEGVITAEMVVVRKGDAETYQPSFTEPLHAGTEFRQVESRPGWRHIEIESGARGWIPSDSGELVLQ